MTAPGTLYAVGVGPGDPELLTLKAVSVLARVDVVFCAASSKNDYSLARDIAAPHLKPDVPAIRLDFPMTRDPEVLQRAWSANATAVRDALLAGKNAAFLTLGDPLTYSTFGYLARTLETLMPGAQVEVVPGITSYQAAAARTRRVLAEGSETLMVVPGISRPEALREALDTADNAVVLKAYRNYRAIREAVAESGREKEAMFVTRLGLPGEEIRHGLPEPGHTPNYFTLLLIGPDRNKGS